MSNQTQDIVQAYIAALSQRNLNDIIAVIAEDIDWYVPGNEELAPWLGRRSSKKEIIAFYDLLWAAAEPISIDVKRFIVQDNFAVICGEFSSRMLKTDKIINSLFYIDIEVKDRLISRYRLLEDSNALIEALIPTPEK